MSAVPCPAREETRRRVALRLADALPAAESRLLKAHVASCRACAAEALAADPTLLFSSLALEAPRASDAAAGSRMAADVLAAIELERTRRRFAPRARRVLLRAASVVLVAGSALTVGHLARRPLAAPVAQAPAPPPVPPPAPLIEELRNPGATVYQFASSSPREPNVVFVVDRNADI